LFPFLLVGFRLLLFRPFLSVLLLRSSLCTLLVDDLPDELFGALAQVGVAYDHPGRNVISTLVVAHFLDESLADECASAVGEMELEAHTSIDGFELRFSERDEHLAGQNELRESLDKCIDRLVSELGSKGRFVGITHRVAPR